MNREIIDSVGVFDLTEPLTITKPDTGDRFQSMQVVNQDHYNQFIAYDPGDYELTQEDIGTRYVIVMFRTVIDPDDPEDLAKAHALQDQIEWTESDPGELEIPDWDKATLDGLRAAVLEMSPYVPNAERMFGKKEDVEPVRHLWGTAAGWLGQPTADVIYLNVTPEKDDGETPYVLEIPADVPVDGFWSISLYNERGFFQENEQNAYSANSFSARSNADGTTIVHFGGDPGAPNYLAIMPGWNYTFRFHRPRRAIIDGNWIAPAPEPVARSFSIYRSTKMKPTPSLDHHIEAAHVGMRP